MKEALRRAQEVVEVIDTITAGKGLRAAQRRALGECRRMASRLARDLEAKEEGKASEQVPEVEGVVARICELLHAYLCNRG